MTPAERHNAKRAAIEAEYGQPMEQVVRQFAEDGEGMGATGEILGYCQSAFKRLCKRRGWNQWFRPPTETNGYRAAKEALRGRPVNPMVLDAARKANPTYKRVTLDGVTDTLAGHARRRGIPVRTVYNRIRAGRTIEQALHTGSYVTQPGNQNHYWRQV